MWIAKVGMVFARGRELERDYIENELGTKIILVGLEGRIEEGVEAFEYQDNDRSFEFIATRVDAKTNAVLDSYTVWLGGALNRIERAHPSDPITVDRARTIARSIKEALLVWRYPGNLANILSCHSPARRVVFDMKKWDKWYAALEGEWP